MPFLIAIDGPAGAGKSTVARRVARELGYTYLDTGAMYRSVAWKALTSGIADDDQAALESAARDMAIRFSPLHEDGGQQVFVDDAEVTSAIRTAEVSNFTSRISAIARVRTVVVEQQRRIAGAADRGVVLEGRDIGTVVFPDAQLKVFLTASAAERARRRAEEMCGVGIEVDAAAILRDIVERDDRDSRRATSPLVQAADAVAVDTDGLAIDDVVSRILGLWRERQK